MSEPENTIPRRTFLGLLGKAVAITVTLPTLARAVVTGEKSVEHPLATGVFNLDGEGNVVRPPEDGHMCADCPHDSPVPYEGKNFFTDFAPYEELREWAEWDYAEFLASTQFSKTFDVPGWEITFLRCNKNEALALCKRN